jgi:hypothetical protein
MLKAVDKWKVARFASILGIVATTLLAILWCREMLRQPVLNNWTFLRLVPFALGFVLAFWKLLLVTKDPKSNSLGSSLTIAPLFFMLTDSDINSYSFLMASIITLAYVVATTYLTFSKFVPRFSEGK